MRRAGDDARAALADQRLAEARRRLAAISGAQWNLADGGHIVDLLKQIEELREVRSLMNSALYTARRTVRCYDGPKARR